MLLHDIGNFKIIRFRSKINQANISYIIVASDEKVLRAIKHKNTSDFVMFC